MLAGCLAHLRHLTGHCLHRIGAHLSALTKPAPPSLATGLVTDLLRSKQELVLENALLRQQLIGDCEDQVCCLSAEQAGVV